MYKYGYNATHCNNVQVKCNNVISDSLKNKNKNKNTLST